MCIADCLRSRGLLFLVLAFTTFGPQFTARAVQKPNVIVIFADDLGWHDVGVQGGTEVKTPNLDALARNGIRFTSGYVTAPLCSPSRAGLLTGRYQQRFGHETNPGVKLELAPEFGLPVTETTVGDRMRSLGYATGWVGKSHMGAVTNLYHPLLRGFDEFYGFLEGDHDYTRLCDASDRDPIRRGYERICETEYLTYAFAREVTNYVARHKAEPFFLYAPFNAVHTPHSAPPELLARFPASQYPDPGRRMMLAVLAGLDDAVGTIVTQLRALNLETNTLVIFSADNGGFPSDNYSINTPLRGMKTQCYEGGIRVPFFMQWPGVLPTNRVINTPVSTLDILPTAVAIAGGTVPAAWQLDGVNLMPFLTGQAASLPRTNLYWRIETDGVQNDEGTRDGIRAVRSGDWKLIKAGARLTWELYNLATDVSETNNLADANPEIVQRLIADYDAWAAQLAKPLWGYNHLQYEPIPFITEDVRIGDAHHSVLALDIRPGAPEMVLQDEVNQLWQGELDPITGNFRRSGGRDRLIDSAVAPLSSAGNGPEWGVSASGAALFYAKPGAANRLQATRARLEGDGVVITPLSGGANSDVAGIRPSQDAHRASVRIAFSSGAPGNFLRSWADETSPTQTTPFPSYVGPATGGNWIPNSAAFTYLGSSQISPFPQIVRYDTVSKALEFVTADAGEKADVCSFSAPELNGALCFAAIVDRNVIAVYADRKNNANGLYSRIATLTLPTGTTQRFLYSLRPIAGARGFNGVSYFTCSAFQNNDPKNPGDSGIWLFGLGPDPEHFLARRVDEGLDSEQLFPGRREPRTMIGEREVFCYYLSDAAGQTQLRMAKTGLKTPDYRGTPTGFTALRTSRSFSSGGVDSQQRLMAGTELTQLVGYEGRLYAGIGNRRNDPYPTDTNNIPPAWTGAQILVKDSASAPWHVDDLTPPIFRAHVRVEAFEAITLTTRVGGAKLPAPVTLLVAGLSDISAAGADLASVRVRAPGSVDGWEHSTVATSTIPANVMALGSHVDVDTGVDTIFAGLENGEIYRGGLNVNGKLVWQSASPELSGGGPITGFSQCNRQLYAISGVRQSLSNAPVNGGLYLREDANNSWRLVYRWPTPAPEFLAAAEDRVAYGLSTAPNPEGGTNRVLLLGRGWPGVIERIDPTADHAVTVELDVRDFFARLWHDDRVRERSCVVGYMGFTAVTNPLTAEPVQLVGVWIEHPDPSAPSHRGSHFLIRHLDATYEAGDILNDLTTGELRATRCIANSPFPEDAGSVFYFGGFDTANDTSAYTAWAMRADWTGWPGLTISRPNPPDVQLAWPIASTNWMLETEASIRNGGAWQPVPGRPTRSTASATQSVEAQSQSAVFRLRKQ